MKKREQSLRDLCDTTNPTNVLIVRLPEKEKDTQSTFEEISRKCPNLMKDMNLKIQEV